MHRKFCVAAALLTFVYKLGLKIKHDPQINDTDLRQASSTTRSTATFTTRRGDEARLNLRRRRRSTTTVSSHREHEQTPGEEVHLLGFALASRGIVFVAKQHVVAALMLNDSRDDKRCTDLLVERFALGIIARRLQRRREDFGSILNSYGYWATRRGNYINRRATVRKSSRVPRVSPDT
ncbi:hypothetical protein GBF38_001249 [Nibea albiflora]|uniref:Uncharacterized protein n=1 Tax=Nibea albiflora TaxID=240163 RepID=A0ACB7ETQ4_NIBAL|nr:hypothetical protein GBF38_001249 [Nibea albiflora]